MTTPTRAVLATLASEATEISGTELALRAHLGSGTLYPLLGRLTRMGFVTAREETPQERSAHTRRGPLRRYYTLTDDGRAHVARHGWPGRDPAAASFTICAPASATLNVATGELTVSLAVPQALPTIELNHMTARIERPDGSRDETRLSRPATGG